jgi:transcription-repair coupling factor (superfamily II helicase)
MYLYFVGDDNKAYYNSNAFGRILSYLQLNISRTNLRELKGKRSMVVDNVKDVRSALEILKTIETLPAA